MRKSEWGDWPNFSYTEMQCSATGENDMVPAFMDSLQRLRTQCEFAFKVSSGFRSMQHPIEKAKALAGRPKGTHCQGLAVDIAVSGALAHRLLLYALQPDSGFHGFGIAQRGDHDLRFIHLDGVIDKEGFPRPTVWSY